MNPMKYIAEKIDQNDATFVHKLIIIYITSLIILLMAVYIIFYFNKLNLAQNIIELKKKKDDISKIIDEKNTAESKKILINNLLRSTESFRLKDYVHSTLQKNNFIKYYVGQNENISEQRINKDYNELTMNTEFSNLSTLEMLEILATLENDTRVYIKNIYIKNLSNHKLYVAISLATLQLISS